MAFSLLDNAESIGWLAATIAVNFGLSVALYRGWVHPGGCFQVSVVMLACLLGMQATMSIHKVWSPSLSGGTETAEKVGASWTTQNEMNYLWLAFAGVCFLCMAIICLCSEGDRRRARARELPPPPPPPPPRRRNSRGRRA